MHQLCGYMLSCRPATRLPHGYVSHPRASTLDPRPSTLDPRPPTLGPSTLDRRPSTVERRPSTDGHDDDERREAVSARAPSDCGTHCTPSTQQPSTRDDITHSICASTSTMCQTHPHGVEHAASPASTGRHCTVQPLPSRCMGGERTLVEVLLREMHAAVCFLSTFSFTE